LPPACWDARQQERRLSTYGDAFPDFVARYRPAAELSYLPDLARLEWARIRAANAPDDPSLELRGLASMEPEVLESLRLSLHVAASLVYSPFPIFDIWRAHQYCDSDEQLPQIELAKGSQHVLVSRPGTLEVGLALLGAGDSALLTALTGGSAFGAACRAAVLAEADYDLGARLGDLACIRALNADRSTNQPH
jgi:hypothetical protein